MHGIQSWVALPDGHEDIDPSFTHYPASTLPQRARDRVSLVVVAGEAFGLRSPVHTLWPTLYVHAGFGSGASLDVPAEHDERAVYVVSGELAAGESKIIEGQLAVLEPGTQVTLRAAGETQAMLLGGKRFPTPRYIWWNFVASSRERIALAKERWAKGQFMPVPGETEFIPLPPE